MFSEAFLKKLKMKVVKANRRSNTGTEERSFWLGTLPSAKLKPGRPRRSPHAGAFCEKPTPEDALLENLRLGPTTSIHVSGVSRAMTAKTSTGFRTTGASPIKAVTVTERRSCLM